MQANIVDSWNCYLNMFDEGQKDIYYYEEYVRLYENDKQKAFCIVCFENGSVLLMPFLRGECEGWYDFETVYGYGGPIANVNDPKWIDEALNAMKICFQNENYLCGFVRFHCFLGTSQYCQKYMEIIFDRNTVSINTDMTEDEIWMKQVSSKNRNMIRKAERNGLIYKAEYDFESLNEFVTLYNLTMRRLNADEFYIFEKNYYTDFIENLKGKAFLGTVKKDEKMICGALFMYSGKYGHYHLEGSDVNYSSLGANNYLLWRTALEMSRLGVKEFHLGGGYNSESNNSLLKFKKAFSNNLKDFYIGKWIFDLQKYCEIKTDWMENNPDKKEQYGKLLLCYRY